MSFILHLFFQGIQGTSTPQIFLEGDNANSKIFVFSAEKSEKGDATGVSNVTGEELSMSHLTFEEKQAYFAEQIKVQEAEALKSGSKSPMPSQRKLSNSNRLTVDGKN